MPQFDVYANPGKTGKAFPFIVDIQNSLLEDMTTRIVVPLGLPETFIRQGMVHLIPEVEYRGQAYLLVIPQISSVPLSILKHADGSLARYRQEIISALDFAVTGI